MDHVSVSRSVDEGRVTFEPVGWDSIQKLEAKLKPGELGGSAKPPLAVLLDVFHTMESQEQ